MAAQVAAEATVVAEARVEVEEEVRTEKAGVEAEVDATAARAGQVEEEAVAALEGRVAADD